MRLCTFVYNYIYIYTHTSLHFYIYLYIYTHVLPHTCVMFRNRIALTKHHTPAPATSNPPSARSPTQTVVRHTLRPDKLRRTIKTAAVDPRPRTDAAGNRKCGLCAPFAHRKKTGGPQADTVTR